MRGPFSTRIGTKVLVVSVMVVFTIGQIVFLAVGGQVGQRHAIMRSDEIDIGERTSSLMRKIITGAGKASRKLAPRAVMSQPVGAAGIAKAVIPLAPTGRKLS